MAELRVLDRWALVAVLFVAAEAGTAEHSGQLELGTTECHPVSILTLKRRTLRHMIIKTSLRLPVLIFVCVGFALAQPSIPDTPAGHALRAWMHAFNGGNRDDIETYIKTINPSQFSASCLARFCFGWASVSGVRIGISPLVPAFDPPHN